MRSRAERAAAARANHRPTREEVMAAAARDFPTEDIVTVMAILDEYGSESYHRERERVQRAILILADGNVDKLLAYTKDARVDYRDVLWWAEYPEDYDAFHQKFNADFPGGVQEFIAWLKQPRDKPSVSSPERSKPDDQGF